MCRINPVVSCPYLNINCLSVLLYYLLLLLLLLFVLLFLLTQQCTVYAYTLKYLLSLLFILVSWDAYAGDCCPSVSPSVQLKLSNPV